jgi:predicted nucleic acid-binding protein
MAAVLLDTTVFIDVLRGRHATIARLGELRRSGESIYACAVNAEELMSGVRAGEREAVSLLMAGTLVAPLGLAEGTRAGEWRRAFAKRGRTLTQADCLIASAAAGVGARLATGNPKDFPMSGLFVEHWPVGS